MKKARSATPNQQMRPLTGNHPKSNFFSGIALLLSSGLLFAAQMPPVGAQPAAHFPLTLEGVYTVDVAHRYDPATGRLATAVTGTAENAKTSSGSPQAVIDGLERQGWEVEAAPNAPDVQLQLNLDLGREVQLSRISTHWQHPQLTPQHYALFGSRDGTNFEPLTAERATDGSHAFTDDFEAKNVRYVRLEARGGSERGLIRLLAIKAFPHTSAVPPSSDDGLNITTLRGVSQTTPDRDQWGSWSSVIHGEVRGTSVTGHAKATSDAIIEIDFGDTFPLFRIGLEMGGRGNENPTWAHGGKVEISPDGSEWKTLLDQKTPLGATSIEVPDGPIFARYLRLTNYYAPGKGTGTGRLYQIEAYAGRADATPRPLAHIEIPADGTFSAAIYNANGNLIRTLFKAVPTVAGQRALFWDRRNDMGDLVDPEGSYTWRALASQAAGVDEGSVGQGGNPPYGDATIQSMVADVAVDEQDNLYEVSQWDERHHGLRRMTPDGSRVWGVRSPGGLRVATDGEFVYVANIFGRSPNTTIQRFQAADGEAAPFPTAEHIIFDAGKVYPGGLAVDGQNLYANNFTDDLLLIYDKTTGEKKAELSVPGPRGVVVQSEPDAGASGVIWVANSGDRVTKYSLTNDGKISAGEAISGLQAPAGVAIGGPQRHLYITETGTGRILEFDISGKPAPAGLKQFGRLHVPGPVSDDAFFWLPEDQPDAGIAVDTQGRFTVTDRGNRRVQRFHPDGTLWQSRFAEFQPSPFVDKFPAPGRHQMISAGWEYEVDVSGNTHPGWLGDGTWRLSHNWRPTDGRFVAQHVMRRTLQVDANTRRDFLFHFDADRTAIYAVEPDGMRRSVIIGGTWIGGEEPATETWNGRWIWTDRNGNGKIDLVGTDPTPADTEVVVEQRINRNFVTLAPGRWIDEAGNLWFSRIIQDRFPAHIAKLPLQGFDEIGNPLYDWSQLELVVGRDTTDWNFMTRNARIANNGDIYAIGDSAKAGPRRSGLWSGGGAMARYNGEGEREFVMGLWDGNISVIAPDSDGNSGFWYTGHNQLPWGHYVTMYDAHGLVVAVLRPGPPNNNYAGWMDHAMSLYPFIQPDTDKRYVYAEDNVYGKSIRYRIDGVETISQFEGKATILP